MLVHCFSGSPYTWSVLMTLEHKGIEHEARYMPRMSGDHRSADMLAANPRGRLPILEDGDLRLYESLAICRWLEHTHPEPSLLPSSREGRALAEIRLAEIPYMLAPFDDVGMYLMTTPADQRDTETYDAKLGALHAELARWEGYLASPDEHGRGGGPFLAGDAFSLSDVGFYPLLAFVARVGLALDPRYPALTRYAARLAAREAVETSSPPHWRDGPGSDIGFADYDARHPVGA